MQQMHCIGLPFIESLLQNRLQMVLRHIDDEWIAGVVTQKHRLNRGPYGIRRSANVANLIDTQRFHQDIVGDAIAAKRLQRSCEDRPGFGIAREFCVFLEQCERETVKIESPKPW